MGFVRFMASTAGRALRIVAGVVLIAVGASVGGWWWVLAIAGLVPLLAGIADVCVFAPIFGQAFRGRAIRRAH